MSITTIPDNPQPNERKLTNNNVNLPGVISMRSSKRFNKAGLAAIFAVAVLALAVLSAGCVNTDTPSGTTGTISVAGSTTVLPVAQAVAEVYMKNHANADIQISGGGSGVGVTTVSSGTADIGMLSRDLKSSEKEGHNFKEYIIGRDGIAIIAHPSNSVSALTLAQVKDIYQGKITNWKEVGGSDTTIVLVGRDSASGTREFFTEFVLNKEDAAKTMQELNSNGAVQQSVAQTPGAIGYVSLEYVDNTVKAFPIDGVKPSVATVIDGTYTINRPLLMITDGEPTSLAKSYLDFILSAEGQKILSDNGFVPVSGSSTSTGDVSGTISLAGSTTVLPVAQAVAEVYMKNHANADIQISGGGSGVGVTTVSSGTADIGMLSRDLKSSEKEGHNFKEYIIGRDGIAIIAHPSNSVSALTLAQVKDIYQGKITNWKEVGGSDTTIVLVGRDSASGTREFFTEFVLNKEDAAKTMQELNSNGAVQQSVAQTPGAIGYVSLEYVDNTVKAFTIDGVKPSVATVIDGTYTINRPLLMITDGEPTGLAKSYLDFILSAEGQKILSDNGFVPVA